MLQLTETVHAAVISNIVPDFSKEWNNVNRLHSTLLQSRRLVLLQDHKITKGGLLFSRSNT